MGENKIISMHQPCYIPWLGYFYKISRSDIFVFTDDSKYSTTGMHNYHYIKTPHGLLRLKIPVDYPKGSNAKINEVRTKDELGWKAQHLLNLEHNYKRGRHFEEVFFDFKSLISEEYPNLAVMNQKIITFICQKFGMDVQFISSSSFDISESKEEKIINVCKLLGGNVYYSGTGAKAYQVTDHFTENGISLVYSDFKPFAYYQPWGTFESNVTILDFLFEYGYNWDEVINRMKS